MAFGAGKSTLVYETAIVRHYHYRVGCSSAISCDKGWMGSVRNQRILYEMIFGDVSYSMAGVL